MKTARSLFSHPYHPLMFMFADEHSSDFKSKDHQLAKSLSHNGTERVIKTPTFLRLLIRIQKEGV